VVDTFAGQAIQNCCTEFSGPAYRLEHAHFDEMAWITIDAAAQISRRLGDTG